VAQKSEKQSMMMEANSMKYDLVIRNGQIVDGSGNKSYIADVAIIDKKIAYIGKVVDETILSIDARNLIVSPGFVDVHSHYDFVPFIDHHLEEKITQGVTTMMIGLCGLSPAPIYPDKVGLLDRYVGFNKSGANPDYNWTTMGEYFDEIQKKGLGINIAALVGHGTIRLNVMGFSSSKANQVEIDEMKKLLKSCISDGVYGMSSGLIYPPGIYSDNQEINELVDMCAKYGVVYATHMRNESNRVEESVEESIEIARKTNVSLQIHHHKAMGKKNWGKIRSTLQMIEKANAEGISVDFDMYPYTYGAGPLRAILPKWAQEGGVEKILERLDDPKIYSLIKQEISTNEQYENLFLLSGKEGNGLTIVYCPKTPECMGKTLAQIGKDMHIEPVDAALFVIKSNHGMDKAMYEVTSQDDLDMTFIHPNAMVGADANRPAKGAMCHPRTYGTFARVINEYVKNKELLSLEDAIAKMTMRPCIKYGIKNKGLIEVGYDADLVIFDLAEMKDLADISNTTRLPTGVKHVLIQGDFAMFNGKTTKSLTGKVLRKGINDE
jgi:N-acyl-D-amino-acid deacylase